jgi:deferrochelatase/peroxidase EfeB
VAASAGATWIGLRQGDAEAAAVTGQPVAFHGDHQAGIATAVQDRMHVAAFDVTATDRGALVRLLRAWTNAAALMSQGQAVGEGAIPSVPQAPPDDTGEALGLPPSRLTITVGFGAGLFERDGKDRFGLRGQRPAGLIDLPHFAGDQLEEARSGGDLIIQACADDPQVAVHAVRNLARLGFGTTAVRWSQLGFGKTSSTTPSEATPRNLFGFKDGTRNIAGDDATGLRDHVWVDPSAGEPDWLNGGTFMVTRRIAMRIENWDRTSLAEQEQIVGRDKLVGAPIGARREHDPVKLAEIPDSHVALAHPDANAGRRMLRRGYSFVDGSNGLGRLDAGLFFIAFCRDPRTQYVPVQSKLSRIDVMAEYVVHTGSGLWAVPAGVKPGGYLGQSLLEG